VLSEHAFAIHPLDLSLTTLSACPAPQLEP
jgi:hypothetical protein